MKSTKNFGFKELKGVMMVNTNSNVVSYIIKDIEEPITKKMMLKIKTELGGNYTLVTNAGVELHSNEVVNNKWKGIRIMRYTGA